MLKTKSENMTKTELCNILGCSLETLNKQLNSNKQLNQDMFKILLNFNKNELISKIYNGYEVSKIDLNLKLEESTNIEESIKNIFANLKELNKIIIATK